MFLIQTMWLFLVTKALIASNIDAEYRNAFHRINNIEKNSGKFSLNNDINKQTPFLN